MYLAYNIIKGRTQFYIRESYQQDDLFLEKSGQDIRENAKGLKKMSRKELARL